MIADIRRFGLTQTTAAVARNEHAKRSQTNYSDCQHCWNCLSWTRNAAFWNPLVVDAAAIVIDQEGGETGATDWLLQPMQLPTSSCSGQEGAERAVLNVRKAWSCRHRTWRR
jgi:hypothetical protein